MLGPFIVVYQPSRGKLGTYNYVVHFLFSSTSALQPLRKVNALVVLDDSITHFAIDWK